MIKSISKTSEMKTKLRQEGKTTILDKTEHIAAILTMNKELEKFRNEYREKNRRVIFDIQKM
jgi:hypothetical protein